MKAFNRTTIFIAASTLLVGFIIGWFIFGSSAPEQHQHAPNDGKMEQTNLNQVWTCSMHPQIRQPEPGQCPLCGMDLIPVSSEESETDDPMAIKMSPTAMQLANVQTAIIQKQKPVKVLRLTGKVQPDERLISSQTAHIGGRVEQLFINYTGEYIQKGQKIASIYSPELITAQSELLEADKVKASQPELFHAAREKLKNWKLTEEQITGILETGKLTEQFLLLSDLDGVVTAKRVNLGDYVKQGASLFEVADLSRVWVLFDVYESDMHWLKVGSEVEYTVPSIPGQKFSGKVNFIDPFIHPKTRVAKARIETSNKGRQLKPEMFAVGRVSTPLQSGEPAIVVPKSAVMWTGERSVIYVKNKESSGFHFAMREVTLGPALGDSYVVLQGLDEGEEIAIHGTFSIDAAAQLAGKPSMMNPEGGAVMTGHNHGKPGDKPSGNHGQHTGPTSLNLETKPSLTPLFESYFQLKNALVNDDFAKALEGGSNFRQALSEVDMAQFEEKGHHIWMEQSSASEQTINIFLKTNDIESARANFIQLSEHVIALAQAFGPFEQTVYVQHCPMANENQGANWLGTNKKISNPYFGSAMLNCGSVTQTIN